MAKAKVDKSKIHGLGVLATTSIARGETVLLIDDSRIVDSEHPLRPELGELDYHQDYLGQGKIILMASPERHINHSCEPNTYVRTISGFRNVIALRDISAGEEITYDYCINGFGDFEWDCSCGAPKCRLHHKSGFFFLPIALQFHYLPLLDTWFVEEFRDQVKSLEKIRDNQS